MAAQTKKNKREEVASDDDTCKNENTAYCDCHDMDFVKCEHITTCIFCSIEERPRTKKFYVLGENESPIYYDFCFYCLLEGKIDLECDWNSYGEVVRQVMDGFHIGFRDGKYDKPKINSKDCQIVELTMLYNQGYEAGKNVRELETKAEAVEPEPKAQMSFSSDEETVPKNKDPAAKALRKLLRSKGIDSSKFTYDTETYPKCVIMLGDTKDHKEVLKELGGKWNANLKCGKGWMFSKKQ